MCERDADYIAFFREFRGNILFFETTTLRNEVQEEIKLNKIFHFIYLNILDEKV